jgi:hypothetical protein
MTTFQKSPHNIDVFRHKIHLMILCLANVLDYTIHFPHNNNTIALENRLFN